jgi:aspartate/methionine/tyrosine aminotransferase
MKSMAHFYLESTFVTSELSKWAGAGAGGWRLGIAILPENYAPEIKTAMLGIGSETYSCAPASIQHAAITAYTDNKLMARYVENERRILKGIGLCVFEAVIAAGLRAHPLKVGFIFGLIFPPINKL